MVQLLFAVDKLDFTKSIDHVECFAGTMSVTKGEWAETSRSSVPRAFSKIKAAPTCSTKTKRFNKGLFSSSWVCLTPLPCLAKEGRDAAAFDLLIDSKRMDLATPEGFSNALWAVATLKPGGGHLTAPVCSTFVIVNLRYLFVSILSSNPSSFTWQCYLGGFLNQSSNSNQIPVLQPGHGII